MDRDKVLDRIRRLLRLAESSNVHEAATAAARAQELMARHRIEVAALLPAGLVEDIRDHRDAPLDGSKRLRPWKIELASVVARANGCRIYLRESRGVDAIVLVGRVDDAELVRSLYAELVKRVEALARKHGEGRDRAFCSAFRLGVVVTLDERLRLANAEAKRRALAAPSVPDAASDAAPDDDAPALELGEAGTRLALRRLDERDEAVDRFMDETLRLTRGKTKNLRADAEGFARGRLVGHTLAIAPRGDGRDGR